MLTNFLTKNSWILFLVACLSVATTASTWILVGRLENINQRVAHTLEVITESQQALTCLLDCETAYRAYLITPEKTYLEPYERCYKHIADHIAQIKLLTADQPAQQALIPGISQLASDKIKFTQKAIDVRDAAELGTPASALIDLKPGKLLMDKFRSTIDKINSNERMRLDSFKRESEKLSQDVYMSVFALSLVVIALLAQVFATTKAYVEEQARGRDLLEARIKTQSDELVNSDNQLKMLFDLMPQLGWTAQPNGFIDFYNKGWYEYTGTTLEEMQGWGWEKVHDPEMLTSVIERWKRSIETVTPFEMKFPLRGADGQFRWFLTRVRPMLDESGKCIRWVGINTDIEDERQASEMLEEKVQQRTLELALARDEAIQANQLKSQFVANISHEIRTPMSGILGLTELLTHETEGQTKETANHILSSSRNLMQLVNDLLDLSKLEAGRIDIIDDTFKIDQLIDDVFTAFYVSAKKKNLKLIQDVDKVILGDVCGDGNRIRQVLQNLVQNAIKFTDQGTVEVNAFLQKEDNGLHYVQFAVKDTGPGISPENQKKLFQLFVQVDGSTTRRHGGTGLGLALSKRLVELMGGIIGVESTIGMGSTFWFSLPLKVGACILK